MKKTSNIDWNDLRNSKRRSIIKEKLKIIGG
jgi:hypothetical protein